MVYSSSAEDASAHLQHERIARECMIAEQNRAYEESLMADREKVRALVAQRKDG